MSVFIKSMKMPESCSECQCLRHDSIDFASAYQCNLTFTTFDDNSTEMWTERLPNCPLVEIPTPHSRLIDADAFDERIRLAGGIVEEEITEDFKDGVLTVLEMLKTQPTVIDAEKSDT